MTDARKGIGVRSFSSHTSAQTLAEFLDSFKVFGGVEGHSRRTLAIYQEAFNSLISHVGAVTVTDVNPGMVRSWINSLLEAGYSKVTVNIRLRAVRAAFNWLHREGHLSENPIAQVKQLRVPRQYPYVLSEVQVSALLKAVNRGSWIGKRNWAMLLTLLDAMPRLFELIALDLADVSLQARSIRVRHGKGDKERVVFMGRRLTKAMHDWLQIRGHFGGEERVFVTRGGSGLDPRNVQRILQRLGVKAGIEGVRVSPHTLRHTGATLFIRYGGDPFSLQQLLGHSSITTTQIYVHMAGVALREAHAKASPVDRLMER